MRTSQGFNFLAVALLVSCSAAYAKQGDAKETSRPISGVTSKFQLLNPVIGSGESVKILITLHNESAAAVEFRYVSGSFIEHIRVYDARHRQVPVRLNAPFLESGADKVDLQPGEEYVNVVTADLSQMYDLTAGVYELRFYYDLRLIADEASAAKSMKRYRSKDWVLWDTKKYSLTVVDHELTNSPTGNTLEDAANAAQAPTSAGSTASGRPEVSKDGTRLGATIEEFRSLLGPPQNQEILKRTANLKWTRTRASAESFVPNVFAVNVAFLDGMACEIALRSRQRLTPRKLSELAKRFVPTVRNSDFARAKSSFNGFKIYEISDGTFVSVNKHEKHKVIVITGPGLHPK